MRRYLTTFMLAFTLMFCAACAYSEGTSSTETVRLSEVAYKALSGVIVATPGVIYFVLNNKKKDE